jgi:opacity protein-like surface antigen
MKKIIMILSLVVLIAPAAFAADVDGRTGSGTLGRAGNAFGRGLLNVVGFPFEISSTMIRETETHSWLWPITGLPRLGNNIFVRAASTVNDLFFLPLSAPFSNDVSPLTEPMGLPEYPWQIQPS